MNNTHENWGFGIYQQQMILNGTESCISASDRWNMLSTYTKMKFPMGNIYESHITHTYIVMYQLVTTNC